MNVFDGLWELILEALKQHMLQELNSGVSRKCYTLSLSAFLHKQHKPVAEAFGKLTAFLIRHSHF